MATPSPRNFSQYSGLDRFKMQQGMPSAFERQQDSLTYGPGSDQDMLLKSQYSWAAPLSERPATASGRSYNDPERVMERRMRDDNGPSYRRPGGFGVETNITRSPISGMGGRSSRIRPDRPSGQSGGMGFPSLGGLGASLNGQLQQSMGAGAAVGAPSISIRIPSFGGATKGAGRKMVANAMFPNTKGYFY
jgi:hypothetical protein